MADWQCQLTVTCYKSLSHDGGRGWPQNSRHRSWLELNLNVTHNLLFQVLRGVTTAIYVQNQDPKRTDNFVPEDLGTNQCLNL